MSKHATCAFPASTTSSCLLKIRSDSH